MITLTKKQDIILKGIKAGMPIKAIARALKCNIATIYKQLNRIRIKENRPKKFWQKHPGGLSSHLYRGVPEGNDLRLHGLAFRIKILNSHGSIRPGFVHRDIDFTIQFFEECIVLHLIKDFRGSSVDDVIRQSLRFLQDALGGIERKFGLLLIKGRNSRIRMVKGHLAECNNEIAEDFNERRDRLKIRGTKDGLVWAEIDNSFNLNEFETKHPKQFKTDMKDVLIPFFNDLRDWHEENPNMPIVLSDMYKTILLMMGKDLQSLKGESLNNREASQKDMPDYFG